MSTDSKARGAAHGKWVLTQEAFERLLAWLDADRERAGEKYEEVRRRLIKIFTCRGCHEAEDLADEAINRVARRVEEIAATYSGDPTLYFYGVARKVHLEQLRRKPASPPQPAKQPGETERDYACLERCIQQLTDDNRELILQYYQEEKGAKIGLRKRLAEQLGIALNALRIRAYRVRAVLEKCMQDCLEQQGG